MNAPNPRLLLAIALLAIGGTAVGAVALASPEKQEDGVLEVRMDDGSIALESASVEAGRRVFDVTNVGSEEHEVVVLRTAKEPDALALGLHGVSIRYSGELVVGEDHVALRHKHRAGVVLGLLPGESQRYQVDLSPGHYVVYCQTSSHYLDAERTEFTVR